MRPPLPGYYECGVVLPATTALVGVVAIGGVGAALATGEAAAGAGVTGVVTGVIVTPVTLPVMSAFRFLPMVPRARRVAAALSSAAARAVALRG